MHFWFWYSILDCFSKCYISFLYWLLSKTEWPVITGVPLTPKVGVQGSPSRLHKRKLPPSYVSSNHFLPHFFFFFFTNFLFSSGSSLQCVLSYWIFSFPSFHPLQNHGSSSHFQDDACFSYPFPQGSSLVLISTVLLYTSPSVLSPWCFPDPTH